MTIQRILCLTALIGVADVALADPPISNHSLGVLEGTAAFCAELDPEAAAKYQERAKRYVAGMQEKQVAEARDSGQYKEAYQSAGATLSAMSKDQAKKACSGLLQGGGK